MSAYNLVRSGRNFTLFFLLNAELIVFDKPFTACRYLYPFQRYLRSNSKVVVNCTDFCIFFALQNFKGAVLPKVVRALTPQFKVTSSAKVSSGYTF